VSLDGKRYESSSYKYFSVRVCLFCSQFFSNSNTSSDNIDDIEKIVMSTNDTNEILCNANMNRKNIALNCMAYQSSTVDNANATYAVQESIISTTSIINDYMVIPYSKTRREENAFWEVDLGITVYTYLSCII
jgi:hypothetical protein